MKMPTTVARGSVGLPLALLVAGALWGGRLPAPERLSPDEPPVSCPDLRFSSATGKPLDTIHISGVPAEFGDLLAAHVVAADGGAPSLAFAERLEDGRVALQVPLYPTGAIGGGRVSLQITDGAGQSCESVDIQIEALPLAPGAFGEFVALAQEVIRIQAAAVGSTPDELRDATADAMPAPFLPLMMAQQLIDGTDNPNSLRAMVAGEAPYFAGAPPEEWELLDALLARSGALDRLRDYLEALRRPASPRGADGPDAEVGAVTGVTRDVNRSLGVCDGPFYHPDAAALARMMRLSHVSRMAIDAPAAVYLEGAGLALSVGTVLATASGAGGTRLAAAYAGAATGIFAVQKGIEMMDGLLPSEFVDLSFELTPATFREDDEVDGVWNTALLRARSKGWNADKAVLESLLQLSGTKAAGGLATWFNRFVPDGIATELANGVQDLIVQTSVGKIIEAAAGDSGVLRVPPCVFGPTDVSDEQWSEAEILDASNAPAFITGHGSFRVRATGEAFLRVKTREQMFGFLRTGKTESIQVAPIEVALDPQGAFVEAGNTVRFSAAVTNARNTDLEWTITPQGSHQLVLGDAGTHSATVLTSADPDDYPAIVRARSTATLGLRGAPERAERYSDAAIQTSRLRVSPSATCVQPGQTLQFSADSVPPGVEWSVDVGTITSGGLFTAPRRAGAAVVQATSTVNPGATSTASVRIGPCSCWWTFDGGGVLPGASSWITGHFMGDASNRIILLTANLMEPGGLGTVTIGDMRPGGLPAGQTGTFHPSFVAMINFPDGTGPWMSASTPQMREAAPREPVLVLTRNDTVLEGHLLAQLLKEAGTGYQVADVSIRFRVPQSMRECLLP